MNLRKLAEFVLQVVPPIQVKQQQVQREDARVQQDVLQLNKGWYVQTDGLFY